MDVKLTLGSVNAQVIQGRREVSKGIGTELVGVLIRSAMEMSQQSENGYKTLGNKAKFRSVKDAQNRM